MKLAEVSVRRPVFAFMMSLALVVLGFASYRKLGLDLMPKTDYPVVFVRTSLPGASAEEVETQLSKPIEEVVNTISGIDELRSGSDQGSSRVIITFSLEKNIDVAVQEVRDKVATIVARFPRDTLPPVIQKVDPDSAPVLTIAVSGNRSAKELTEVVDKQIKQVLETVKDVGDVTFTGERRREIQLLLNADRMNAYGLTVDQVRAAVQRQNVEIPGGTFITGSSEIALRTMGRIKNVADFNRVILAYRDGSTVTFGDIGRVSDTVEEVRSLARLDGQPAISLMIRKQSGTNTVTVVDAILARIERIKPNLPPDVRIETLRDQSRFIRKSVDDIQHHLVLGGLFASIVVFFFIRNIRSTVIAALAIPTSIIGTFTVMNALGFTLNNMTMLALSLATGIVIDDAIVVLENIFRYVEEKGMMPRQAAILATSEIGLAVMATTLSLVVIFLPVAFMTGQVGRYFYSFGISSAAAILISMFVSFTLTPALCAAWLRPIDVGKHGTKSKSQGFYSLIDRGYGHMLSWSIRHRFVMLLVAAGVTASAVLLLPKLGTELVPDDDQSEFSVGVRMPKGTSFVRTDEYIREVESEIKKLPHVKTMFTSISADGRNDIWIGLTDLNDRDISQQEIMRRARGVVRKFTGARLSVSGGTDISGASTSGSRGGPGTNRLYLLIQGREISDLQTYVMKLIDKVRTVKGLVDVDTSFETTQPELRVNIDRTRAADLGVTIDSLASNLRVLVGGEEVSRFKEGDDQYVVRLRLDEPFRNNAAAMGQLLVPSSTQRPMQVSDIAQLRLEPGPASIDRYNRQRQVSLTANLDNIPLGEAVAATRLKIEELNLKPGYQVIFGGGARSLDEASGDFVVAVVLSVIFIYMVLASQFNSFVHPLTIMTALPLSLPAGLLTLLAFNRTLNIYSAIGLMMLFGVVKKNSILQVDYTNTLRSAGMERHEAIIQANHTRLRPILMTTISIIAGMLPIAFGRGAGAGSRSSMALTIIGGQMLCLLLTLLVTPVVYSYFDDLREWRPSKAFARLRGAKAEPASPPEPESAN
jgi:hydrophobic/amphiphilic exporter-1 (mainly G- bacteria), HAE1 family